MTILYENGKRNQLRFFVVARNWCAIVNLNQTRDYDNYKYFRLFIVGCRESENEQRRNYGQIYHANSI